MSEYCTFCEIVAGRLPSRKVHEEDDILVFHNRLNWFRVQIMLIPKRHMTQSELWQSGDLMSRIGKLAVQLGEEMCPDGYRIVSNFGRDALQTQFHAHVHLIGGKNLIGGADLGLYVGGPIPYY